MEIRLRASIAVVVFSLGVAGCTTVGNEGTITYGAGSRSVLYDSLDAVAADSTAVAIVTVDDQEMYSVDTGGDLADTYTVSSATVVSVLDAPSLASTPAVSRVREGKRIEIRQMGDPSMQLEAPILNVGGTYLLFLVASTLPGDAGRQFYVTGASAGMYAASSAASESAAEVLRLSASGAASTDVKVAVDDLSADPFTKVGDEGDTVPETVTAADLAG